MTKFMPQPYNDKNLAYLHSLMQQKKHAPENWPNYTVEVRGEATSDFSSTSDDTSITYKKSSKKSKVESVHKNLGISGQKQEDLNINKRKELYKKPPSNTSISRKEIDLKTLQSTNTCNDSMRSTDTSVLYDDEIPVMNFDPMSLTDDIKGLINRGFRSQSVQLTKISTQLEEIYNILQEKKIGNFSEICNTGNFTEKYQIDLPFKNLEDFQNFDSKLKTDTKFQEDVKFNIWTLVDSKSSLTHTILLLRNIEIIQKLRRLPSKVFVKV
ncbi:uncharacterized protein LOC120359214 isoform X2 [Solenopsis invicta]|uniref:uncharacterized protein LOC120359214 isoform X2 n=1 Tax=Solenopsis invicta TaxID=13686 RepID=UPI00193D63E1|nr:uncharacterized protein LOC120359214 isoform X2 [Solenopsis invicta]